MFCLVDIAPKLEIFYMTTYKKIACESEVEIIGLHKKKCVLALINIHIPVIDHFTAIVHIFSYVMVFICLKFYTVKMLGIIGLHF